MSSSFTSRSMSPPVGKEVDVVVIRKGKEETHRVKIGRLEDGEKDAAAANADKDSGQPPSLHSHRLVDGLPARAPWRGGRNARCRDRRAAGLRGGGARARKYRRRRRAGDRCRGQYLDLAKGGRAHGQHAR